MPDQTDLLLQSRESAGGASAEVLQIRDETPGLEPSLDNANSQLPEVGRNGGWGKANRGSS